MTVHDTALLSMVITVGFIMGFAQTQQLQATNQTQQGGSEYIVQHCELLTSTLEVNCKVNTIHELVGLSPQKSEECCGIARLVQQGSCYNPCYNNITSSILVWNVVCNLNMTTVCNDEIGHVVPGDLTKTNDEEETRVPYDFEGDFGFRSAQLQIDQVEETPQESTSSQRTLILDNSQDQAEVFQAQLSEAMNYLVSSLGDPASSLPQLPAQSPEQISPILQSLRSSPELSTSFDFFNQVPSIHKELNSNRSLTLLAPTNVAWMLYAFQQGISQEDIAQDTAQLEGILMGHIGWGKQSLGSIEYLQNVYIQTMNEGVLDIVRSSLSGNVVVKGCCDVDNQVKVIKTDYVVDPLFVVHVVDGVLLPESSFQVEQNFQEVQQVYGSQSGEDVQQGQLSPDTPMTVEELQALIAASAPPTAYVPNTPTSPTVDIGSSTLTLQQISEQLYATYEQYDQIPQSMSSQQSQDIAPNSPLLEKVQTTNAFDTAPSAQLSSPQQSLEEEDAQVEEIPGEILRIMDQALNREACMNISQVLQSDTELRSLETILVQTQLLQVLNDLAAELDYTLFAPSNEGIEKLVQSMGQSIEEELANGTTMEVILSYHVVPMEVLLAGERSGAKLQTTLKKDEVPLELTVKSIGNLAAIEGVGSEALVQRSLRACGVVIYVIDTLLLPFK